MNNPVLEAIAGRRSIRGYKNEQITQEQLDALMKAALESPSARNSQPWHFSFVMNRDLLDEINTEACANLGREKSDIFYGAPTAVFISCSATERWARHDCGIAVQTLALAAHSLGLGSVILGLPEAAFTSEKGRYFEELLKFPDGHSFAVALAIGIPTTTKDAHPVEPGKIDIIL